MSSTIAKKVTEQLKQHVGKGEDVVTVDSGGVSVSVDVEQSERYAVGIRGVTVKPQQPVQDVGQAAERIVAGVRDLDGPLTVVEYDRGAGQAIVRSAEPETDAEGVTYWEADVRSNETSLQRYRKDHTATDRHSITEPLPHNVAGRIAEQLADALQE